jgi:hypothetical protein
LKETFSRGFHGTERKSLQQTIDEFTATCSQRPFAPATYEFRLVACKTEVVSQAAYGMRRSTSRQGVERDAPYRHMQGVNFDTSSSHALIIKYPSPRANYARR